MVITQYYRSGKFLTLKKIFHSHSNVINFELISILYCMHQLFHIHIHTCYCTCIGGNVVISDCPISKMSKSK